MLNLPESAYTKIYRAVCRQLKDDPVLSGVVRYWGVFTGKPDDFQAPSVSQYPAVALNVSSTGLNPWSQAANEETMVIDIEMACNGTDMDDLLNLWWAVQKALKPSTRGRRAIIDALKEDKCTTFVVEGFGKSALNHVKFRDDNSVVGTGSIFINLLIKE